MLSDLLIRLRALLRRDVVESEFDDDLRFHFEKQVEELVQSDPLFGQLLDRVRNVGCQFALSILIISQN
jgi:hypothetical protein